MATIQCRRKLCESGGLTIDHCGLRGPIPSFYAKLMKIFISPFNRLMKDNILFEGTGNTGDIRLALDRSLVTIALVSAAGKGTQEVHGKMPQRQRTVGFL